MIYRQWSNDWGGIGGGFDKDELAQVTFNVSFCIQHRYLFIDLALLGLMFDAHIFERDTDGDDQLEPGSRT